MRPACFRRVFIAASLALVALTAQSAPAPKASKAAFAEKVLELTNAQRDRLGLAPLALDEHLVSSAQWKADDMAERDYFDHADGNGRDFVDRAEKFGFKDWTYLGENIAAGQTSPEEVVSEWMASPGHRRNILKPQFREIGIAYATDSHSSYKHYWVQEFGTR